MKNKQIIGLVVAGLVFSSVGIVSVVTNHMASKMFNTSKDVFDSVISSTGVSYEVPDNDFIGVISVEGTIAEYTQTQSLFSSNTYGYNHQGNLDFIDAMINSENNKAIFLEVNSPGGYMYESDELYEKLMEYKEKTKRPIYAYFGKNAASGAYYISMAADEIYMNKTGTTGVIISMFNTSELYKKLGIEEINITSGKNKAMGSSGQELTDEQRSIYQSVIDEAYGYFVDVVEKGRGLNRDTVLKIADGRIYTAQQALDLNLIDYISSEEDAKSDIVSKLGFSELEFYTPNHTATDAISSFLGIINNFRPMSQAEVLDEYLKSKGNGVPMYYAQTK